MVSHFEEQRPYLEGLELVTFTCPYLRSPPPPPLGRIVHLISHLAKRRNVRKE